MMALGNASVKSNCMNWPGFFCFFVVFFLLLLLHQISFDLGFEEKFRGNDFNTSTIMLVSLAAVFWMSRNVSSKKRLRGRLRSCMINLLFEEPPFPLLNYSERIALLLILILWHALVWPNDGSHLL